MKGDSVRSKNRWGRWPGRDKAWEYKWGGFHVWREFWGQWWLTGDTLGDDVGPFGTAAAAKAWAEKLRATNVA